MRSNISGACFFKKENEDCAVNKLRNPHYVLFEIHQNSGETGKLVDQLRIACGALICGTGEGRISLKRLGDLAVAVRHIAVASFEFGAALGQLLIGQLDIHRTVPGYRY